jgi:hypothetical protein
MEEPTDRGTTTRAPAVALLAVNSADQEQFNKSTGLLFSTTSPARIYINNQQALLYGFMTRLALTEVSLEYDSPNVNDYNNTLTIGIYDNTNFLLETIRLSFTPGYYTGPLLGKSLSDQLNGNAVLTSFFGPNTFSVSFGGLVCGTNVLAAGETRQTTLPTFQIFTTSALAKFAILPCTVAYPSVGTQPALSALQDDLTNMMGLTPSQASPVCYTIIQSGYASMQYTPFVDIVSNLLTKNQHVRDGTTARTARTSSILARIYLANENFTTRQATVTYADASGAIPGAFIGSTDNAIGTSPGTLRREFAYPKQIQWNTTENVDVIDIEVLDSKSRPLFYQQTTALLGGGGFTGVQINNTADLFFTLQATEN